MLLGIHGRPGTNGLYRNGFAKNAIRSTTIWRLVQQGAKAEWGKCW